MSQNFDLGFSSNICICKGGGEVGKSNTKLQINLSKYTYQIYCYWRRLDIKSSGEY